MRRCLGLTSLRRHQSAQSQTQRDFIEMLHLSGQLHRPIFLAPSLSRAGHTAQLWSARQTYKGQISTLYTTQRGSAACTAAAALTEQAFTNGAAIEQMRGLAQEACAAGHLSGDGTAFLEEHRIRGYEVGPDQQTTIVTMANLLQVPGHSCSRLNCRLSAWYIFKKLLRVRRCIDASMQRTPPMGLIEHCI